VDPDEFAHDLARHVNILMKDPDLRACMGKAGRQRAVDHFSWNAIAQKTMALYRSLL
jgi:starch synthase